jgi:Dna[CI] antecedent, DciA
MRSRGGWMPETLGADVVRELKRLGGAGHSGGDLSDLVEAWTSAVGPAVAANAWPARLRWDGTLVVHTSSSPWAFELSQLEETVRANLGDLAPPRLQFVVGPLPEPQLVTEVSKSIPETGPAERAHGAEIARLIDDGELRELVAKAAAAALAKGASSAGSTGESDIL